MNRRDILEDLDLAAAIAAALETDERVPTAITVEVSDGVVTLEGECENKEQRDAAERVVDRFAHRISRLRNAITFR